MPPYIIKPLNSRVKHIRITITRDGIVKITKPKHVTGTQVEDFVASKAVWIKNHLNRIKFLPPSQSLKLTKKDYLRLKPIAIEFVKTKLEYYNQHYNFLYKNISIKNTKTRWGSCSRRGNLNFNYKISIIPEHLSDYIIVHELCHLGQFNHSQKFWDLVAETIPDYKEKVKELKKIDL